MAGDPPPLRMKLFIDTDARRVAFAEAGKDVADFLFSLLALPLARVTKLVADAGGEAGALGNLRGSAAGMDAAYLQPGAAACWDSLLWPIVLAPPAHTQNRFLPRRRKLYTCTGIYSVDCGTFITDRKGARCPSCGDEMTRVARYVPPPDRRSGSSGGLQRLAGRGSATPTPATAVVCGEGFVRGDATYVVMDDLTVAPASVVSSVELLAGALGTLSIGRVHALQQEDVVFGSDKGKEILKASLQSKTVLTDVFLSRMLV